MSDNKKENKKEWKERSEQEKLKEINFKGWQLFKALKLDIKTLTSKHGWKMVNYIHSNNREGFFEYLFRLYMSYQLTPDKTIFHFFEECEKSGKFKKYALAFMSGFISKREEDKKFQNKEENNE
ncbi:hypothetical protein DRN73_06115 [Candidatus Pacearchaeota archaeon]|nr:MAG: hypothetical protein DRN73_06115 [Candidatus Pacearchaeota archaeon]